MKNKNDKWSLLSPYLYVFLRNMNKVYGHVSYSYFIAGDEGRPTDRQTDIHKMFLLIFPVGVLGNKGEPMIKFQRTINVRDRDIKRQLLLLSQLSMT